MMKLSALRVNSRYPAEFNMMLSEECRSLKNIILDRWPRIFRCTSDSIGSEAPEREDGRKPSFDILPPNPGEPSEALKSDKDKPAPIIREDTCMPNCLEPVADFTSKEAIKGVQDTLRADLVEPLEELDLDGRKPSFGILPPNPGEPSEALKSDKEKAAPIIREDTCMLNCLEPVAVSTSDKEKPAPIGQEGSCLPNFTLKETTKGVQDTLPADLVKPLEELDLKETTKGVQDTLPADLVKPLEELDLKETTKGVQDTLPADLVKPLKELDLPKYESNLTDEGHDAGDEGQSGRDPGGHPETDSQHGKRIGGQMKYHGNIGGRSPFKIWGLFGCYLKGWKMIGSLVTLSAILRCCPGQVHPDICKNIETYIGSGCGVPGRSYCAQISNQLPANLDPECASRIEELYINNGNVSIPPRGLLSFVNLRYLEMVGSSLQTFANALVLSLTTLKCIECDLQGLPEGVMKHLIHLRELYLINATIDKVPSISNLTALTRFMLSGFFLSASGDCPSLPGTSIISGREVIIMIKGGDGRPDLEINYNLTCIVEDDANQELTTMGPNVPTTTPSTMGVPTSPTHITISCSSAGNVMSVILSIVLCIVVIVFAVREGKHHGKTNPY